MIALLVTVLLIIGTSESAKFNAVLVAIKVTALTIFIALTFTSAGRVFRPLSIVPLTLRV